MFGKDRLRANVQWLREVTNDCIVAISKLSQNYDALRIHVKQLHKDNVELDRRLTVVERKSADWTDDNLQTVKAPNPYKPDGKKEWPKG